MQSSGIKQSSNTTNKKTYKAPQLEHYGLLQQLTQSSMMGGTSDGVGKGKSSA